MVAGDDSSSRLTERARSVEHSAIREMFERAAEYPDRDLVHLEIGEPDFDTPEHIVKDAFMIARDGGTHYTSSAGMPELREAIADRTGSNAQFNPETEVAVTTGAMEALYLTLQTIAEDGDEVVVPTPSWPNYLTQIRLAGATPVEVALPASDGFDLEPNRVIEQIGENTVAVILSSPCNPTGQVFSRDAVTEVLEAAAAHGCYVIADEVYDRLTYGDHSTGISTYADHDENVITINSCSKTYAMTGWRIGWLAGPADVVQAAAQVHGYTSSCAPSVSQHAAIAALTGPQEPAERMAAAFADRRDYVVDRIAEIPGISAPTPEGAIYAFIDVADLAGTSVEIAHRLLDDYGVVTAPGEGFGEAGCGYLRISFANSRDRLELGFDRIEAMVEDELEA
ncbi:pyridoxal phosphate-dependent aminotransferase [Natrinema gelatinilyticum]|uniref:pyridoxal phosphate-dependent aminotransferase n=1 Tax=Natrinema gelatinilyticum TaxID=2961571 RepID=UPI0020C2EBE0|nr:pyridoxal phosphate-dependent aminotransferase [Natrinema gelatinilyticum]